MTFNQNGVRLGHDPDLSPQEISEQEVADAAYHFRGCRPGPSFEESMKLLYVSRKGKFHATVVVLGLLSLVPPLWFCYHPGLFADDAMSFADWAFLLAALAIILIPRELVQWLCPVPSVPSAQQLNDFIRRKGPRQVALFNASALEFNTTLRGLMTMVHYPSNVDLRICHVLNYHISLQCSNWVEVDWVEEDLRTYLNALLARATTNEASATAM